MDNLISKDLPNFLYILYNTAIKSGRLIGGFASRYIKATRIYIQNINLS